MSTFQLNKPVKISSAQGALKGLVPSDDIKPGRRYQLPDILRADQLTKLKGVGTWIGPPPKSRELATTNAVPDDSVGFVLLDRFDPEVHGRLFRAALMNVRARGQLVAGGVIGLEPTNHPGGSLTAERRCALDGFGDFADETATARHHRRTNCGVEKRFAA